MSNTKTDVNKRFYMFAAWIAIASALFARPLASFVRMSLAQDDSSYLLVIPFISAGVLFIERRRTFADLSTDRGLAAMFLGLSGLGAITWHFAPSDLQLTAAVLSLVLVCIAGFALLFGKSAVRSGGFALLFLLLMVPPPSFILDRIIYLLQVGSAWLTQLFFDLSGVPFLRQGMVFHLAGADIEIAKECSGIRSSMAMLILALLVVHFYLKNLWKKALFVASGIFMMIVKNGVRIAALTLLSIYVDPGFLYGRIHHEGGVVFFLLGLLLLAPLLWLLRRGEASAVPASSRVPGTEDRPVEGLASVRAWHLRR